MVSTTRIKQKVKTRVEDQAIRSAADAVMVLVQCGLWGVLALWLVSMFLGMAWHHRAKESGSVGLYFLEETLGLNIPFVSADKGSKYVSNQQSGVTGQKVADVALAWAGKTYKPGVKAMCASFVRSVLEDAGVNVGVRQGSAGRLMADSFAGKELGQIIKDKGQLQPGDIVMWRHTYDGPGWDGITHVGIYVGDGMVVDRPTASGPVQHRSIDTFKSFWGALRPAAYGLSNEDDPIRMEALTASIISQESGGDPGAVNDRTGAMGLYQILPSNIAGTGKGWDKQCLGRDVTTSQFLASADIQHQIAQCKLQEYASIHQAKAGSKEELVRRVASTWYSGNGDKWNDTRQQGPGGSEPSISEYTASIWNKYQSR